MHRSSKNANWTKAAGRNRESKLIILYSEKHNLEGGTAVKKWRLRLSYYWYKLLIKLGLKTDEVFYIGGSEALPPPLSKDEEELLVKKITEW